MKMNWLEIYSGRAWTIDPFETVAIAWQSINWYCRCIVSWEVLLNTSLLQQVDIQENQLTDVIPSHLCGLEDLRFDCNRIRPSRNSSQFLCGCNCSFPDSTGIIPGRPPTMSASNDDNETCLDENTTEDVGIPNRTIGANDSSNSTLAPTEEESEYGFADGESIEESTGASSEVSTDIILQIIAQDISHAPTWALAPSDKPQIETFCHLFSGMTTYSARELAFRAITNTWWQLLCIKKG